MNNLKGQITEILKGMQPTAGVVAKSAMTEYDHKEWVIEELIRMHNEEIERMGTRIKKEIEQSLDNFKIKGV